MCVRIVEGLRGRVSMRMELVIRFDYGSIVPWVRKRDRTLLATAGPDTLELHTAVATRGEDMTTVAEFRVGRGERMPFVLNYHASHEAAQPAIDPEQASRRPREDWRGWSDRCTYQGRWREAVLRSLITLKALTYAADRRHRRGARRLRCRSSSAACATGTTAICWLRDATFTLNALLLAGYQDEAVAWREWLLRAAAGSPEDLQILYGVAGERRLDENEVEWLPGYAGAAPVRVGNAASQAVPARRLWRSHGHPAPGARARAWSRSRTRGGSSGPCSNSWNRTGSSPTRASGRCAGRGATSLTPR